MNKPHPKLPHGEGYDEENKLENVETQDLWEEMDFI
jgi:hypothetical protein